jgi:SprT protein
MSEEQILRQAVKTRWVQALNFYGLSLPQPLVDLSLKGRVAGQACLKRTRKVKFLKTAWTEDLSIRLNLGAYRLDPEEMINDTIPHEISHLIATALFPEKKIRPHGCEWQAVMADCFGIHRARRTHQLELPRARQVGRYFVYRCQCQEAHRLTSIRHNRVRRGVIYRCRCCGQPLRFCHVNVNV